jgi:osmotically-inducible protein OsmY
MILAAMLPGCGLAGKQTHNTSLLDDKVLQQRVEAALKRGGKNFQDIHAQAENGTAVLTGTVRSSNVRQGRSKSPGVYTA